MHKMKLAAFAAMSAMTASGPALAATATADLNVSITLINQCKVTGGSINFGNTVGLLDTAIPATGTIAVKCTALAPYTVGLDAGKGNGATTSIRKMSKGTPSASAPVVTYTLAMDSAGGPNWGNAAGSWKSGIGALGAATQYTVYGNVPVQDTPEAGTYNDTVTVTVTY